MSMIRSSAYKHCMQTVGKNEKNKQKLHKLTPDDIRPDKEGVVQEKSHF
jgi:hypothetical protein